MSDRHQQARERAELGCEWGCDDDIRWLLDENQRLRKALERIRDNSDTWHGNIASEALVAAEEQTA